MTEIIQAQTLPVTSALLTVVALAHAAGMLLMLLLCKTLHMHTEQRLKNLQYTLPDK